MGFLSDHMNSKWDMERALEEYRAANQPINVYAANKEAIDARVRETGFSKAYGPTHPVNPAKRSSAEYEGGFCHIFEFKLVRLNGKDVLFGRNAAEATDLNPGWHPVG